MTGTALTPEQRAENAREEAVRSANAAASSATNAATSEANAAKSATRAKKEVEKPTRIAWLTFFVSLFTLGAVGTQSFLTKCSVDLAMDQIQSGKDQMRVAFIQQEKADKERLKVRLDDPSSVFQELQALDANCAIRPPLPPSKKIAASILTQQFYEHYEHYYFMTSALDLRSDWAAICDTAKRLLDTYCHLKERLTPLLEKGTQEFKEGFEKCELPATSQP